MAVRRRDPLLLAWSLLLIPALLGSLVWALQDLNRLLPKRLATDRGTRLICRISEGHHRLVRRFRVWLDPPRIDMLHGDGSHWHTYTRVERAEGGVMARYSNPLQHGVHNRHLWFSRDLRQLRNSTIWIRPPSGQAAPALPPPSTGTCQPDVP